jgi:hypothetical protein
LTIDGPASDRDEERTRRTPVTIMPLTELLAGTPARSECREPECDRPIRRRGLCSRHYRQARQVERWRELAPTAPSLKDAMRIADEMRDRSMKTARARAEGRFGVGPSDLTTCRKQIEYRENPPEGYVPDPVDKGAAYVGTMIHEGIAAVRRILYPWCEIEREIHVPGLDEPGHADVWDPIAHRVEDDKSAGEWAWEKIGRDGAREEDIDQAMLYALGLAEEGLTVVTVRLNYIRRANGEVEVFDFPYDRGRALTALGRLHTILDDLTDGRELPRDREGPSIDPICARYCPAVRHCWDLPNVPQGRTPESWVKVRDDETIAALLVDYNTAPTPEAKKRIRVLLTGLDAGRYGDLILGWRGGKTTEVQDHEARLVQLEAALLAGTPLSELEYPMKSVTSNVSISVEAVRQATLDAEAAEGQ